MTVATKEQTTPIFDVKKVVNHPQAAPEKEPKTTPVGDGKPAETKSPQEMRPKTPIECLKEMWANMGKRQKGRCVDEYITVLTRLSEIGRAA
jgi:hypothetical protein